MTLLAVAVGGRGIVDPDQPVLHADDEALLRGRAAFETMRVYDGKPFRSITSANGWSAGTAPSSSRSPKTRRR